MRFPTSRPREKVLEHLTADNSTFQESPVNAGLSKFDNYFRFIKD